MKKKILLLLMGGLCLALAEPAHGLTYFVATNGSDAAAGTSWLTARQTIQSAVDSASPGDTVLVSNGTYQTGGRAVPGSITTNRVVLDKAVLVKSVNGPVWTVIQGRLGSDLAAIRCVYVTNGAVLEGFALFHGSSRQNGSLTNDQSGGAAWCEPDGLLRFCVISTSVANNKGGGVFGGRLEYCEIINCFAFFGAGVAESTLNRCFVRNNEANSLGGGALNGSLANSLVSGNFAIEGGGTHGSTLVNCTVVGNIGAADAGGSFGGSAVNSILYGNTAPVSSNYLGTSFTYSLMLPYFTGMGNAGGDPLFVNAPAGDFRLQENSPVKNAGQNSAVVGDADLGGLVRIQGSVVDMGAFEIEEFPSTFVSLSGGHIYPYTNWIMAATNIQDAVDTVSAFGEVLVSNGVYQTGGRVATGYLLTNRVVIDKPITVRSVNGPAVTSIRGAWHPGATNGSSAVRAVWMTNGATLVGFTLTNGATRTSGTTATERSGGGLWAQSSLVTVSNCVFRGNAAHTIGGGVYGGTLLNCTLFGNTATFGAGADSCTLNNSTLTGNQAHDSGGGARFSVLSNCTLTANSAPFANGGGAESSTLNNCLLTGNSAALGGGAYLSTLNNCTLTGNSANFGGGAHGGIQNNCIIFFNTAPTGPNHLSSTVNYSCTTPLPVSGTGNTTNTPLFVSLATTNLGLSTGSPCINAGNNAYASGATDLAGNPRIAFATVDMGTFEFQTTAPSGSVHFVSLGNPNAGFPYTNWASAAANIQDAIDAAVTGNFVFVSNGVYHTGGRIVPDDFLPHLLITNRVVIDKPITVRSVNGPAFTSIKGAWHPVTTNGKAAVRCVWMADGSTLAGFTLSNGATHAIGNLARDASGGGVWAESELATISNCIFVGNSAGYYGAGARAGTLYYCTLTGNAAGSQGGGATSSDLNNCLLFGNTAGFSGGGANGSDLNNCLVVGNSAREGGGTWAGEQKNCTIVGNTASQQGGGTQYGSQGNCIIYFNTAPTNANHFDSFMFNTCTTPLPSGSGNITNDPLFVSLATTNLRLAANSPCRDMGDNANAPVGLDLDGNSRIVSGYVDMGAYEFLGSQQGDFDGDGMGNGDERIAGTGFANSNDVFEIENFSIMSPASITFETKTGRVYAVDRNDALIPNPQLWTEFTNNIAGTGSPLVINDPQPGTNRNYRVRVGF